MKKVFLCLALVAVTSSLVFANDCHIRRTTQQLYYYNNGQYYHYNGGSHGQLYYYSDGYYNAYKERIVLVPKAIEVETYRDHYYSIDPIAQQNLLADAVVGRLLRMQSENGGIQKLQKSSGRAIKPTPTTGETSRAVTQESRSGEYQNEALLKIVSDSCVKCHGASSKFTQLVTAEGKLNDLPAGKVWECFGLVNAGEMPKGSEGLSDEGVKLFYEWAKNARKTK